ncbi:cardiolipin synthase [Pseudovibrio exalbescens]|uniref:Cardiolipin synthase n=1 Tax=Pseudovibrio exalbescens TaxID=197461 RepID=A0A1U7JFX6_9HYPH|nr:cardiolipin synthase [Pseudovibrio exalbescens]OKL43605.1 cardiolipin synthase [Pseudovibrio exalbescens]
MDGFFSTVTIVALVTAFIYGLAIVCASREIMWGRTSEGSIAWLLSLFFLPFPTAFLYLIFAWKRFDDYGEIQRGLSSFEQDVNRRHGVLIDHEANETWPVHNRITPLPFLKGNDCRLLIDGEATFRSILEGIRAAQHFILVQFFIVRDDEVGQALADALIDKAREGVTIYFLYDDVGSRSLSRGYINRLRNAGVKVSGFNKRHRLLRLLGPMRLNYRNHRKVVVVDAKQCWVGGHNIGREYLGRSKALGRWRDTHVRVDGPATIAAALSFAEDWQWATGSLLDVALPETLETPGNQPVLVMPTGPADPIEDCSIAFAETISRARDRLWIVSPYFVPGIEVLTALYAAALRGVDVRILLPEKADHRLVWLASYAHADDLIDHGIKIYRYQEGFLHQKVILVDDHLAGIGTVNFDNRSFNINFEITLWFTGAQMIDDTSRMLRTDFDNARQTGLAELRSRRYAFRILCQAAKLFSPIL